jgi:hypothetical protein
MKDADREALAEFRAGRRPHCRHSLHAAETTAPDCRHHWRVIACADDRDLCECSRCGKQGEFACSFDDDYA